MQNISYLNPKHIWRIVSNSLPRGRKYKYIHNSWPKRTLRSWEAAWLFSVHISTNAHWKTPKAAINTQQKRSTTKGTELLAFTSEVSANVKTLKAFESSSPFWISSSSSRLYYITRDAMGLVLLHENWCKLCTRHRTISILLAGTGSHFETFCQNIPGNYKCACRAAKLKYRIAYFHAMISSPNPRNLSPGVIYWCVFLEREFQIQL